MKKVLVTGATGFIGKSTLQPLLNAGFEVIAVSRRSPDERLKKECPICWERCDILDTYKQVEILKKYQPSHLIHLAWAVPPGEFWHSLDNVKWLSASIQLFKHFCENGGKCFLSAGTLAEYDWTAGELQEEKTPLKPPTLYGQCKKALQESLKEMQVKYYSDTAVIWPRIGYFFGENEPSNKLISTLIKKIRNQEPIELVDPELVRDYAHVRYLGGSLAFFIKNTQEKNMTLNISGNNQLKLKDIVNFIAEYFGVDAILSAPYQSKVNEPRFLKVDTQKMIEKGYEIPDTFYSDLTDMMEVK